jgi:peroxiredoxin
MPEVNREEFRQLSAALKPNLCGANFPDLTLQSPSGDWRSLSDMDHDFRLVVIWDSECEHCVEQMEALNVMQDLLASLDVGVYAVGYDFQPEGWRDVIRQHAWDFAMHVSDVPSMQNQVVRDSLLLNGLTNQESLGFREYLDIRTTPKLYLLDSNNKILSKGMGAEAVPDLVRARAQGSGR